MYGLPGLQRDILFVLNSMDEPNGQDLRRELQRSQGREIAPTRLYPNLDELAGRGFVEKRSESRANRYTLTERGRSIVRDRFEWEEAYLAATAQ